MSPATRSQYFIVNKYGHRVADEKQPYNELAEANVEAFVALAFELLPTILHRQMSR
jgi:hypothetical protein